MKYGNRSPWKRIFYSPVSIVIVCIIFILILHGAWGVHEKALIAQARLDQARAELADLQQQQSSLSASIAQLSTSDGIEAALREKYHAVKEGESVAVIVDTSTSDNKNASTSQAFSTSTPKSWWGNILQFIGL